MYSVLEYALFRKHSLLRNWFAAYSVPSKRQLTNSLAAEVKGSTQVMSKDTEPVASTSRHLNLSWLTAKLLLVLASTVILGSESHRTHGHVLLSDGSGSRQLRYILILSSHFFHRLPYVSFPKFCTHSAQCIYPIYRTEFEQNRS
jgi:hypothetical protein